MTVKELLDIIVDLKDDTLVVLASDAEGNSFSPLAECSSESYVAETSYSGEIVDQEDDGVTDGVAAIVMWPTN